MGDLIERQEAIDVVASFDILDGHTDQQELIYRIRQLQPAEPEIVRCKDCKFYSPMNRETKTGICNLTLHQNFGDDWFCAGAERRTNG